MRPSVPERSVPPPEPDPVPWVKAILILLGVLAVFGIAVGASQVTRLRWKRSQPPQQPLPGNLGQRNIHLVDQQLFDLNHENLRRCAAQRARLGSYGWAARDRGLIHIPLTVAADELLEEEKEGKR